MRAVTPVRSRQIARFCAVNSHLESAQINLRGYNDLEPDPNKREFIYTKADVTPPDRLYFVGKDWRVLNTQLSVSIGGTTSPSQDSFNMALLLAQLVIKNDCGLDAMVVSGGVVGIDTAAHLGALDAGSKTLAVVANAPWCGLHLYYPKRSFIENGILDHSGGIVSEYLEMFANYRTEPKNPLYQRNRIITALSDIFIAVECTRNSGTVDTAKRAKLQGKTVLAIDWEAVEGVWKAPQRGGNDQLFEECIAERFPPPGRDPLNIDDFSVAFLDFIASVVPTLVPLQGFPRPPSSR